MRQTWFGLLGYGLLSVIFPALADDFGDRVAKAVADGAISVDFRYRYEFADDGAFDEDAHASTLKSRLTFAPELNEDWRFLVEFDDVRHVGADSFSDTRNGKVLRPQIPDPEGTDLNQAYVAYSGFDDLEFLLGRQRITRGNQRFIGSRPWRQNEQSYDSLVMNYAPEGALSASYGYVFLVNTPFGPERGSPARDLETSIHLIDGQYVFNDQLTLVGHVYLMEFDDFSVLSNATIGFQALGAVDLWEAIRLHYRASYASQEDYGNNTVSFDTNFGHVEVDFELLRWGVRAAVGLEVLGAGDVAGGGFRTPLASVHPHLGHADRFTAATTFGLNEGIRDSYLRVSGSVLGADVTATVHSFDADRGGRDWGSEFDLSASWHFLDRYGLLLKLASFDADSFASDLTRAWVQVSASF